MITCDVCKKEISRSLSEDCKGPIRMVLVSKSDEVHGRDEEYPAAFNDICGNCLFNLKVSMRQWGPEFRTGGGKYVRAFVGLPILAKESARYDKAHEIVMKQLKEEDDKDFKETTHL